MILYDFILLTVFVLYFPIMFFNGKAHNGLKERFGYISKDKAEILRRYKNIWIHAVSVGEVFAIKKLLKNLNDKYPDYQIVLTVSTKTGYALAKRLFNNTAVLLWAPIDVSFVVKKFIKLINPLIYVAVETEIWPNQFQILNSLGVPTMIVNGRISDKAWPKYRFFKSFFKSTLKCIDHICVQSLLDGERFIALGASKSRITVLSSIKWDDSPEGLPQDHSMITCDDHEFIFVAGSTHPGEEDVVLRAFCHLKKRFLSLKIIIVPRHVNRTENIEAICINMNLKFQRYSDLKVKGKFEDVLIVDEIGHLKEFYAIADVVFVGKSLRVGGGHNIIEPAYFGKPIIIGPYMENFKTIAQTFIKKNAVIQIQQDQELSGVVEKILMDEKYRKSFSIKTRDVIESHKGATKQIIQHIENLLV